MFNTGYGKADLHMHSTHSDGLATVQQMIESAEQRGLNVVAITDHDRLGGSVWAYENRHRFNVDVVPGVEVSTLGGHVLGLWVTRPIKSRMSVKDTIDAIHQQGGIAVLAHPFHIHMHYVARRALDYWREPEKLVEWGLDAVEVHNAGMVTPFMNLISRAMARRAGLPGLGNSDAHTQGAVASGRTYFPGSTADDLREAILAGTTIARGGAWAFSEYRTFIHRHIILKRGRIFTDEIVNDVMAEVVADIVSDMAGEDIDLNEDGARGARAV